MAKFKNAQDKQNGKLYNIDQLDKLKPTDLILSKLVCTYCGCPLIFHHSGKRKAYLSTKPGKNHSEECKKKVHREEAKERRIHKYVGNEALTRTQQSRIAKNGYKTWRRKSTSIAIKKENSSTSKRVTLKTKKTRSSSYRPVAESNGTVPRGRKEEKMHTRVPLVAPANIENYIGQAIKVVGRIIGVKAKKYTASISLVRDGMENRVYLNEATFRNSAVGLRAALIELEKRIRNKEFRALMCAVVDVIPDSKGRPMCMLRTDDGLVVNGYEIRVALR